jgi:hypothetical protein
MAKIILLKISKNFKHFLFLGICLKYDAYDFLELMRILNFELESNIKHFLYLLQIQINKFMQRYMDA